MLALLLVVAAAVQASCHRVQERSEESTVAVLSESNLERFVNVQGNDIGLMEEARWTVRGHNGRSLLMHTARTAADERLLQAMDDSSETHLAPNRRNESLLPSQLFVVTALVLLLLLLFVPYMAMRAALSHALRRMTVLSETLPDAILLVMAYAFIHLLYQSVSNP